MFSNQIKILALCFLLSSTILSQNEDRFLPDKRGKWSVKSNLSNIPKKEKNAFEKNLNTVAEWFHKNIPLMATPKGFDLPVTFYNMWDDEYKLRDCNYSYRCEIDFAFELFMKENGKETKWTIEPPHYSFNINDTEAGHGTNFHNEGYIVQQDDPSLEEPLEKVCAELGDFFQAFPLVKNIAQGVNLYGDGNLIIFNPDRPPFWIPVTVREVIELKLAYYKIKEGKQPFVYTYIKNVYDKMTPEELNSPAYYGGDAIVNITADYKDGLQIMRFNKDYWDRSLPKSAVQFITMYYLPENEFDMDEFIKNNGHPNYGQLLMNELPLNELITLIKQ